MTLTHLESFTLGIVVLFAGKFINEKIPFLRDFNIPEPVTGGLIFAILISAVFFVTGLEISFALEARDVLILYFFTGIGINADLRTLLAGGRPLLFLLAAAYRSRDLPSSRGSRRVGVTPCSKWLPGPDSNQRHGG